MEQLINIIIILVIIASVLKRIREVGDTRGNLNKPAQPGRPPIPGQGPMAEQKPPVAPRPMMGSEPMPGPAPEPQAAMEEPSAADEIPTLRDMLGPLVEPLYREPEIPSPEPMYDAAYTEDTWEQAQRDIADRIRESQEAYRRVQEQPAALAPEPMRPVTKPSGGIDLRFNGRSVVNGIIMSEILGPPKAMREESR